MRIALVTAVPAFTLDDDLQPLLEACTLRGIDASVVAWDDPTVSWRRFDAVLLRSPWDYVARLPEFLHWCDRVETMTRLVNPAHVVRTNTDKHYLLALAGLGIPIVPSRFVDPGDDAASALHELLAMQHDATEFVVKPCVGAGSRDAQRYPRNAASQAIAHAERLLGTGRGVLLQPYLDRVDQDGETAMIYLGGRFSHAIRKGPLLHAGQGPTSHLFAPETISPREPGADERMLADRVLAALPGLLGMEQGIVYARVDLLRNADGSPCLLELELTEPSLFFSQAAGSAGLLLASLLDYLGSCSAKSRP